MKNSRATPPYARIPVCPHVPPSLCPHVPVSLCPSVPLSLCPFVPMSLCPYVPMSPCPNRLQRRIQLPEPFVLARKGRAIRGVGRHPCRDTDDAVARTIDRFPHAGA